jgi:hypothetical protein
MQYFIKWRHAAGSPRLHISEAFLTRDAAIQSACVLLRVKTHELWIEDSEGHRIEADEIRRNCEHFARQQIAS